ncbi:hypothetical protein EDB85DRAFT_2280446 [Lactarius pseudohatsudake]|nr:hypothetical protein EDB85DRAFT_2280446 [Lactarius pseudohatsudake]
MQAGNDVREGSRISQGGHAGFRHPCFAIRKTIHVRVSGEWNILLNAIGAIESEIDRESRTRRINQPLITIFNQARMPALCAYHFCVPYVTNVVFTAISYLCFHNYFFRATTRTDRNGRLAPIHSGQPNWKQNSHKLRATVVGDRDARSVGDGASFHDDAIVAPTVPSTPIGRAGSISPDDTIAGLLQPRWRAPAHSLSASLDGQTIPPTRHRASTELPCSRGQLAPRRGTVGVLRIYVPRASRPVRADQRLSASFRRRASKVDPY